MAKIYPDRSQQPAARPHDDQLEGLRSLDSQALASVHSAYFPDLYRFAYHRLGDKQTAEDLASETFSSLLSALHRRRGPKTNLRGWLFGTLNNLLNDHWRKVYKENLDTSPIGKHKLEAADVSARIEELRDLRRAMQSLTEDQQRVIGLRFGAEYSLSETAEIMDKNPNAIKALQFRALSALRRELVKDS